jgi:S1-C subfamily serine protease
MTIGNSFDTTEDSGPSVTLGVLSGIRRDAQDNAIRLETSAATNPGQEGGPYFNIHGDLIGLEHNLPKDDDLATLTPIDRIVANYAVSKPNEAIFDRPRMLTPPQSLSETMSQGFAIAAKRARSGVVTVVPSYADAKVDLPALGGLPARRGPISGTLVDATGIVVTALAPFVVEPSAIDVYAADGSKVAGKLLARDFKSGFAVLSIDPAGKSFSVLETRSQASLEIGQFIIVVGAPDGPPEAAITRDGFVTTGILSAQHQIDVFRDALETDAGINMKNAAGAVVDLHGRLVGIAFPPFLPFGQNSGLGFVMPIEAVKALVPRWREGGTIEPAVLGATLSDNAGGGVRIDSVVPDQPAAKADLRAGDAILEADGTKLADRQAFTDFLARKKCAGDPVTLTIARGKDSLTVSLKLGKRS